MTQPPPYDGSAQVPPTHTTPGKARPGTKGIWIGIGLLVLAVVIPVVGIFTVMKPMFGEDAVFAADGQPHEVDLPADEERGLWLREGTAASCTAVDADGAEIRFGGTGGSYSINEWTARNKFDTGAGDVTFTCEATAGTGTDVRIGPLPGIGQVMGAVLLSCGVGLLLGIGGLVLLIMTLVKRSRS